MKTKLSFFKGILLLFLMFTKLSAQETFELASNTLSNGNKIVIYPVEKQNVEYYPFVDEKIFTKDYQKLLDEKKRLQPIYDSYISARRKDSTTYAKKNQIIENLNSYIFKSKDQILLDKSEILAKELKFNFVVDNQSSQYDGYGMRPKKQLYIIDEKGKYASKSMLKEYIDAVNKDLRDWQPVTPSPETNSYLSLQREISLFPEKNKMTFGKVKSKLPSTKSTYITFKDLFNQDYGNVEGTYKILSKQMSISNDEIKDELIPIENLDSSISSYYVLAENTNSGKLYAINNSGLNEIKSLNNLQKLEGKLISLGYKPYRFNGYPQLYVNTTYYKVEAMPYLYEELEKDNSYLKKLDQHYLKVIALNKQAKIYNTKFEKFLQLYSIQRNRMSTVNINNWTTLTKSGIQLLKQIVKLNDDPIESNSYPLNDKAYDTSFADYVGTSRNILGL